MTASTTMDPIEELQERREPISARREALQRQRDTLEQTRKAAHAALVAGTGAPDAVASADSQLAALGNALAEVDRELLPIDTELTRLRTDVARDERERASIERAVAMSHACTASLEALIELRARAAEALTAYRFAQRDYRNVRDAFAQVVFDEVPSKDPLGLVEEEGGDLSAVAHTGDGNAALPIVLGQRDYPRGKQIAATRLPLPSLGHAGPILDAAANSIRYQ